MRQSGPEIQVHSKIWDGGCRNLSFDLILSVQWVGMDGFPYIPVIRGNFPDFFIITGSTDHRTHIIIRSQETSNYILSHEIPQPK